MSTHSAETIGGQFNQRPVGDASVRGYSAPIMPDPELAPPDPDIATSETILGALRRISRRVHVQSKRLARHSGQTAPQVLCLRVLAAASTDMTVAALGHAVQLSSPTVTGILDRLERGGYVVRVRDTVDRRRVFVRLTPQGLLRVSEPRPLDNDFIGRFGELPAAERSVILASLERIAALMELDEVSR